MTPSIAWPGHERSRRPTPAVQSELRASRCAAAAPLAALLGVLVLAPEAAVARTLSFEERVVCQRAVEEVYWRHRLWPAENRRPKPPLEAAVPGSSIVRKAQDSLRKTALLAKLWDVDVSSADLQREMDRMSAGSRSPELLAEIFEALGNDPLLLAECLARPQLVDRLVRHWYAGDPSLHREARAAARAAREWSDDPEIAAAQGGQVEEIEVAKEEDPSDVSPATSSSGRGPAALRLTPPEWNGLASSLADALASPRDEALQGGARRGRPPAQEEDAFGSIPLGRLGPLQEDEHRFFAIALLARSPRHLRIATVSWPKRTFDAWWESARESVGDVEPATGDAYRLPSPSVAACADGAWARIEGRTPEPRQFHAALWTGTEMLVWGGFGFAGYVGSGGRYNPATDHWTPMSAGASAPSARGEVAAVWTGQEAIIWGGYDGAHKSSGARYEPLTDTWTATRLDATTPSPRAGHSGVWTGTEMIVWGGYNGSSYLKTGGRYDPVSDTWTPTRNDASAPINRSLHAAVWTGSEMIVWGGYNGTFPTSGGRYAPATDTWQPTAVDSFTPSGRNYHVGVWTGTEMIVWGGHDPVTLNTGGRYNPATNSWARTRWDATTPVTRTYFAGAWTGTELIVWGGWHPSSVENPFLDSGGRYDPVADTWRPTGTGAGLPLPRRLHTAVWTGSELIAWGGETTLYHTFLNSGGRYDPKSDAWQPVAPLERSPQARERHSAVWTGAEMIVFGGLSRASEVLGSGGRFDPATDTWTPTREEQATAGKRYEHSAVWTGSEMIVWGGYREGATAGGARYDPAADTWIPVRSDATAPAPRALHTAVWTGSEMIVWGGLDNTGGRYTPATDSWLPTETVGAPPGRGEHSAVWTGSEMIVWGGSSGATYMDSGGRYSPDENLWTPTGLGGAPAPRRVHSAVWTGSEMIVWGGSDGTQKNTGGRYLPRDDAWVPTVVDVSTPTARGDHGAVWTGSEMVIWGGSDDPVGGRYDPLLDAWSATEIDTSTPRPRTRQSAVWTGSTMMIWGGSSAAGYHGDGGGYCACTGPLTTYFRDADGDGSGDPSAPTESCGGPPPGFSPDAGDCDDANPQAWGAPEEVLDLVFTDAATLAWTPTMAGAPPEAARYDTLRSPDAGEFVTGAICLESLDGPDTVAQDQSSPGLDGFFHYLVRGRTGCPGPTGVGSLGTTSAGLPRAGRDCP